MIERQSDGRGRSTRSRRLASLLPVLVFLSLPLLMLLSLSHLRVSVPLASDVPADVFSAGRAIEHVRRIAAAPHPIGSVNNTEVGRYILGKLAQMGYAAHVQSGLALAPDYLTAGMVNNIVVRVPGREPGKAVLLVAHYDSVRGSPGAADNAASVASILETLRALRTTGPLAHDIICLFSDGEEAGMLGARRFLQEKEMFRQVGLVLNFDYRGNSGPIWMFETSGGNASPVQGWGAAVERPLGNSLLSEIYRRMPNDTDLSIFKQKGISGLNFAAAERYNSYHTRLDNAGELDLGMLQQQGTMMLAMVRYFGQLGTEQLGAPGDAVYFTVPGLGLISYPADRALSTVVVAALLVVVLIVVQARSGALRPSRALLSGTAFMFAAAGIALLCQAGWAMLRGIHPGYRLLLHGSTYNGEWYFGAFLFLTLALFVVWQIFVGRWFQPAERTAGALLYALLFALVTGWGIPGASYLFVWPLTGLAGTELARHFLPGFRLKPVLDAVLRIAGIAPAVLLIFPMVQLMYVALTPELLAVPVAFFVVLLALTNPIWSPQPSARLGGLFIVFSIALFIAASAEAGFNEERPEPVHLTYVQDSLDGSAFWASTDREPNSWLSKVLGQHYLAPPARLFGADKESTRIGRALRTGQQGPSVRVVRDKVSGAVRTISLEIQAARVAEALRMHVDGVPVLHSSLQGRPFTAEPITDWNAEFYGPGSETISVVIAVPRSSPFQIRIVDIADGLPETPVPMPAYLMLQPFGDSGTTQLVHTLQLSR